MGGQHERVKRLLEMEQIIKQHPEGISFMDLKVMVYPWGLRDIKLTELLIYLGSVGKAKVEYIPIKNRVNSSYILVKPIQ